MKNIFRSDLINFLLWIGLAFVSANFLPNIASLLVIAFLAYRYINSKDNLLYFTVFIILISDLAGLFGKSFNNLVSFSLIDLNLIQVFIFINYIKLFFQWKNRPVLHFKKALIVYLFYFLVLIILGFFVGVESSGKSGLRHYFFIANILLLVPIFIVLPYNLRGNNFSLRLSNLLFIVVFINLMGQIIMLLWGVPLAQILNPDPTYRITAGDTNYIQEALRPILAPWLMLLALFLSFLSIAGKSVHFKKNYLYIIVFLSFMSIFITATRGWILAFIIFIGISSMLYSVKEGRRIALLAFVSLALFVVLYFTSSLFRVQIGKSFERFATVELILEGDISAGGTSIRHIRGADVMEGFYESPIIGLGFSSDSLDLSDQHVGNQMILLSGGIIGMIIILYLLIYIVLKSLKINNYLLSSGTSFGKYYGELKLIPAFIASLFFIHSTSTALFGYSIYTKAYGNMLWVVISFSLINLIINEYFAQQNG